VSCLGILSGKGGSLASKFGGSHSRVDLACFYGKTFWRVCLAGQFGGSSWLIYSIGFKTEKTYAVEQGKKWEGYEMYYGESVDCNIIM
jgi:hypothetical protein